MKEKCKLYFVFYGYKLCKVNLINAIVCKNSSFKVDMRENKKITNLVSNIALILPIQWTIAE